MRKLLSLAFATLLVLPSLFATQAAGPLNADSVRQKLTAAHFQFEEKAEDDAAKMKTMALILKATKFKVPASEGHVTVMVLELKDPSGKAAVKAEIEGQFAQIKAISAKTVARIIQEESNAILTLSHRVEDQELAGKIEASLK